MATAVAVPGGRSCRAWRRGVEQSSLCALRLLPTSSRLLLDGARPLPPTWLPKSSELLWLLWELSVLRFSELESCRSEWAERVVVLWAGLLRW